MDKVGELIKQMREQGPRFAGRPGQAGGLPDGMMRGPGGRGRMQGLGASSMSRPPTAKDETEKRILAVLEDLNPSRSRGMMNVPIEDGRLLRLLAETTGARHIVEIGTSNGYSGLWQCLALGATGGKP